MFIHPSAREPYRHRMDESIDDFTATADRLAHRIDALRGALNEAIDATIPRLDGARACGRALGLKRGLGWKVYALATGSGLPDALEVLPRRAGWKLVLASLRSLKCPRGKLGALSAAVEDVLEIVGSPHIGRNALRSIASGRLDPPKEAALMLQARRTMRESAEVVYGVRCDLQLGAYVVGPPDDDGWVDMVSVLAFESIRRTRPGPPIPIKWTTRSWHPEWPADRSWVPLGADPMKAGLVSRHSSRQAWPRYLQCQDCEAGTVVSLTGGVRLGPRSMRLVFAERALRAGTIGKPDDRADLHVTTVVPTATCIFEVWVHRACPMITLPSASLRGSTQSSEPLPDAGEASPLPLEARVRSVADTDGLTEHPPMNAMHRTMLRRATKALGAAAAEFRGFRVVVPDPPSGASVFLRWRM